MYTLCVANSRRSYMCCEHCTVRKCYCTVFLAQLSLSLVSIFRALHSFCCSPRKYSCDHIFVSRLLYHNCKYYMLSVFENDMQLTKNGSSPCIGTNFWSTHGPCPRIQQASFAGQEGHLTCARSSWFSCRTSFRPQGRSASEMVA